MTVILRYVENIWHLTNFRSSFDDISLSDGPLEYAFASNLNISNGWPHLRKTSVKRIYPRTVYLTKISQRTNKVQRVVDEFAQSADN